MINTINNTETATDSKCTKLSWQHIQQINKTKSSINTNNRVFLINLFIYYYIFLLMTKTQITYLYTSDVFLFLFFVECADCERLKAFKTNFIDSSSFRWCKCPCQWNSLSRQSKIFSEVGFCFTVVYFLAYDCF